MMTPDMPGHTFDDAEAMGVILGEAALDACGGERRPPEAVVPRRRARRAARTDLSADAQTRPTNVCFRHAVKRGHYC